jgi:uncharacterized protein
MMKLNTFDWITLILVMIGGLNWGLIGFFNFDLIGAIFGNMSGLSRIIYALVGLSAIWVVALSGHLHKMKMMMPMQDKMQSMQK